MALNVAEIDERVQALRDRIKESERSIREYQGQRNNLSPLFKLPNEVIHRILDFILDSEFPPVAPFAVWPPGRVPSWIPLTHVCRRLRCLSIGYPHLWSRIGDINDEWIYSLEARSDPGPMDVIINVDHHELAVVPILLTHLHRIRTLHLKGNARRLEVALAFLRKPAPQLEVFVLDRTDCPGGGSDEDPILGLPDNIFSGCAPSIRCLKIGNRISFKRAFPVLTKSGGLQMISDRSGLLSAKETLENLLSAPMLRNFDHLYLQQRGKTLQGKDDEAGQALVHMAHMQSIFVAAENDHGDAATLFSSLYAPSLHRCTIACTFTHSWIDTDKIVFEALGSFLHRCENFPPVLSARLEALNYVQGVNFFGWRIPQQGRSGDSGLIESSTHPYRQTASLQFLLLPNDGIILLDRLRFFQLLCFHFPLENVVTLTITVDFEYESEQCIDMLKPLKCIQSLKLVGSLLARGIIEAATPPAPTDKPFAAPTHLFPTLSKLTITCRRLHFGDNPENEILLVLLPLLARRRREIGCPLDRVIFKECFRYSQEADDALEGIVDARWDNAGLWRTKSTDWWLAFME